MNNITDMMLINFNGYPIVKIKTNAVFSNEVNSVIENCHLTETRFFKKNDTEKKFLLSNDAHVLDNKALQDLKKMIWGHFCGYVDKILEIENQFYMCNSWVTKQKANQYHPKHKHPNAIFSSVFYIKTEKTQLNFYCDKSKIQEGFFFDYEVKRYNIFNSASWNIPIDEGDLIIFPGELNHDTSEYKGKKDRIVVGSSYFIQGELGTDGNYNSISIKNSGKNG